MTTCLNCENKFEGSYCNKFGQKHLEKSTNFRMFVSDILSNLFFFDSRLYQTISTILIHPVKIGHEYLQGKRVVYTPPLQFFLFTMSIYLLIFYQVYFYFDLFTIWFVYVFQ